jgi:hypothetical protein
VANAGLFSFLASADSPLAEASPGDGAVPAVAYTKKLVIDYFLEGDSVRSNPHLRAFTASSSPAE